jgi:hypothetical protein
VPLSSHESSGPNETEAENRGLSATGNKIGTFRGVGIARLNL